MDFKPAHFREAHFEGCGRGRGTCCGSDRPDELKMSLREILDMERLMGRVGSGPCEFRDLAGMGRSDQGDGRRRIAFHAEIARVPFAFRNASRNRGRGETDYEMLW